MGTLYYYGMRALLILYLTKHFLFDDLKAGLIYGSYVALIYGLPLLGGILADRYLGMKKSVTFGLFYWCSGIYLWQLKENLLL